MGASDSNLNSYGYDYVLAVTQQSINDSAFDFLRRKQPVISVCYVYDDNGDPKRIDYDEFKQLAHGTDPFRIPASGADHDAAVKLLDEAGLMFGFQAAMGVPTGFKVADLPPIIALGAGPKDPLTYRLLCRTFTLVELKAIPHKPSVYAAQCQPTGPSGKPCIFSYTDIHLAQQPVRDVREFLSGEASQALPAATREAVSAHPDAFSIQQLLFDVTKAACADRPEISGVSGLLREKLYADFSIEYFAQMRNSGPPMLAVVPVSNDPMAGLQTEFSVNPYPAHPELGCVNYLCAAPGHSLPAPQSLAWNWLEPSDHDVDGVCVVSRKQLVEQLKSQLEGYVARNRWLPHPVFIEVYMTTYDARFGVFDQEHWHGKPPDNLVIRFDTFDEPAGGGVLLDWQFGTSRTYQYLSGSSWMQGETTFTLKVTCEGNQIIIEQHALIFCQLVMVTFWRDKWHLVDLKITDTFTLSTTHDGRLTAVRDTKTEDHPDTVDPWAVAPELQNEFTAVQNKVRSQIASTMVDIPLGLFDDIVFPGGRSFLFNKVQFSNQQDLVAHISYTDQS